MLYEKINLKDNYEYLKNNDSEADLVCLIPHFLPEMNRQNEKRPSILICPGGGYSFCCEREGEPIAIHFMEMGFNAYVLHYSVKAQHCYPLQLNEVAAAFDTIAKMEEEHHGDRQRIAIAGFSAGGHLAAHYSTAFDSDAVRENFKDSIRPMASILCYPVITADERYSHKGSFENLLGEYPDSETAKKFSCENLVKENTPTAFIWHTAEDNIVPVQNSLLYANALSKHNIPFELHVYPRGGHGFSTADIVTSHSEFEEGKYVHNWLTSLKNWIKFML